MITRLATLIALTLILLLLGTACDSSTPDAVDVSRFDTAGNNGESPREMHEGPYEPRPELRDAMRNRLTSARLITEGGMAASNASYPERLEPAIKNLKPGDGSDLDKLIDDILQAWRNGDHPLVVNLLQRAVHLPSGSHYCESIDLDCGDDGTRDSQDTAPPSDERSETKERTHIVERGDTLFGVAYDLYGNSDHYKAIMEANGIEEIGTLKTGQELEIPPNPDD